MPLLRRLAALLFWLAAAFAFVSAMLPAKEAPSIFWWDKANHMAAFVVLAALARLAYPAAGLLRLAALTIAFGGLIEACQAIPFIHRDASWADLLADAVAVLLGLLLTEPLLRWFDRRRRPHLNGDGDQRAT